MTSLKTRRDPQNPVDSALRRGHARVRAIRMTAPSITVERRDHLLLLGVKPT